MRALRLLPLLALTGLVLLAAPATAASWPAQAAEDAKIVDFDFSPRRLTVQAFVNRWEPAGSWALLVLPPPRD